MLPVRYINDVYSTSNPNHPMFLRQLSPFGSSFLPRSRQALYGAGFRSGGASSTSAYLHHFVPAPHPWWSGQGFPPWPPRLLHPAAPQVFSGRTVRTANGNTGNFGGSWCSFYTSAGLMMERPDRDREPPHKRRKSAEGHKGGGAPASKEGGAKGEYHHTPDHHRDFGHQPNHQHKDRSRDKGENGSGKDFSREKSRDKNVERTKSGDRSTQNETQNKGRTLHHHHWHKSSQPAESRTQTTKSKPEQDAVCAHKPRPNPWFKGKSADQQGRPEGSSGGQFAALPTQPRHPGFPPNAWQVVGAGRQPPPPGTCAPDRKPDPVQVKPLQRQWEASPACSADVEPPGVSKAFDFSVMSYNILSQDLLLDNSYLYRHCNPGVLPWEYRLPNLLKEIQQHNADILCLQEVQEDHFVNQIKPALLALGYQCEYKKRTGRKPDGCAIVFKTSRLSLVSSNPVEFFRPGDTLLDRDNVGLVLLLQPKDATCQSDPSASICVANTHLLYNPRRGDIKLAQLAILLAEIHRLTRLPDGSTSPVLLCGDFNSTPCSPLYSFLTTGCLDYTGLQIGMVSGQESSPRGQRLLTSPIWSRSLGISRSCQYESKPVESNPTSPTVEGAISNLTVEDLANKAAASYNRATIEHSLKLQSSYRHRLMPDGRPEITTCHSRTAVTVDYILYTPEFTTPPPSSSSSSLPGGRGLQLLGRLSLVGQPELEEVNGLPNQSHSSDHLPLLTRFRFRC
ncbi:protein angel homolog 2 isoform X1 [Sphaeramia orbicularis]|uniref:Endonuclease/exonuclease/phosphatase domain-containing protein n=2 Tax=Sphaeramia orbicularis TaxID=375764 RepID=A0A673CBB2_9TELE|nr:protein angel homolog 2 isoform X1 [Sphaeramia orbicularis]